MVYGTHFGLSPQNTIAISAQYMDYGRINMKRQLSLYFPEDLVAELDKSKGPLSRSRLIVLILQSAVEKGIDLSKLVSGGTAA